MPVKQLRYLLYFAEIYLVGALISRIIQRGFPTNPIYWGAILVEVTLSFLTYKVYKRALVDKSYKSWNFLIQILTVIGVGAPITLFYTVDSLKPAGGTWAAYLLTINSLYIYRILKKEPLSREGIPTSRGLLTSSKVFHSLCLTTVLAMVLVVALLPTFGYVPVFGKKDPDLVLIEIILSIMSLLILSVGIYLFRIIRKIWKGSKSDFLIYFLHSLRISLFESVAVFGLILGILGGAWFSWLPLLMLAGAAMVFTFPTSKRWIDWKI